MGLGCEDFCASQGAPDGAHADAVPFTIEVLADGMGASIEPVAGEFKAQREDALPQGFRQCSWAGVRAFGGGNQAGFTVREPSFVELVGPRFRDSILDGYLAVGEALYGYCGDDDVGFGHASLWCPLCRDTSGVWTGVVSVMS